MRRFGAGAALFVVFLFLACGDNGADPEAGTQDITTTYNYDAAAELWRDSIQSVQAAQGSPGSSTVVVKLEQNEPVKEVGVRETLLVGSSQEPTLEVAGQDDPVSGASGRIIICKLFIKKFDAREVVVQNVKVTRLTAVNVATENNLDFQVEPANVIRCGRGGVAVLAFGVGSSENPEAQVLADSTSVKVVTTDGKEGFRANRVRVLGPQGYDGFIETLSVERSSVFGRVELRNLEIQELILDTVTVEY